MPYFLQPRLSLPGSVARIAFPVALTGLVAASNACAEVPTDPPSKPVETASRVENSGLTWGGLTLYGTVDIGVAHLDHGAPLSPFHGPGLTFTVQKFSDRPITSPAPNGLSQSKIGLAGNESVGGGFSLVFKLETGFQPTSLKLTDGPKSLIEANGKSLNQQADSGDSSRAGQILQGAAYAGLQSKTWGSLTYGWQNGLQLDNLQKYDPQLQSQAFSPIGTSGAAAGGGITENSRSDNSLKYALQYKFARLILMHQFASHNGQPGTADEVDVGGDVAGFSIDAALIKLHDALSAASLTAAQNAVAPGTLAGTASDNTMWSLQGKYVRQSATIYAGYEHIIYANPGRPLPNGTRALGGYVLSTVNNNAYSNHRVLQVSWVGLRYSVTRALDVTGAYYRYDQNSYKSIACTDRSASSCSGNLNSASLVADYKLTRHFDVYAGINSSSVAGGLASGFLRTSAFSEIGGVRFNF